MISRKFLFQLNNYNNGVFWMLMLCAVSNLNDILAKYVGSNLPSTEVAFFRFFFSTILLLPLMIIYGKRAFVTQYPVIQLIRAFLLVVAVSSWCYGIVIIPLAVATTIGFTTPFFVLPLAKIFLNEHVGRARWIATFFGFFGIIVIARPSVGDTFNPMTLVLLTSTIIFASLDIINKKLLIENESLLSMLFYSAFGAAILGFPPALLIWQMPTFFELFLMLILGAGANLILFCALKAYTTIEISAIQAFRYCELILSGIFGLIIFHELPPLNSILGISVIISMTLYLFRYEIYQQKMRKTQKNDLPYC